MRASSPRILLALSLFALLITGCSQDRDPFAPQLHDTYYDLKTAPPGYYDTVDTTTPAALRATLHAVIDDNVKIPYTATATDTWDVLEAADQDPNDSGRILDVYLNASYPKYGEGNLDYNREHTWPKSFGFPNDGASNYPYTDCHQLFLSNDSYNSSRNNKAYGNGSAASDEKPTEVNDGMGGGTGVYPGNSNWTGGDAGTGHWETWSGRRGDVARALLYMDVRYEGGNHGVTGYAEPDLILTDDTGLIDASNTGSNLSVAYMGRLSALLQWHAEDPVDDRERARNDAVYAQQGNRNPFIDHPEWVACVFSGDCSGGGDTTPPAAPAGLVAVPGTGSVSLDWNDSGETDFDHYTVYRGTTSGGSYASLGVTSASLFVDNAATGGTTWYYVVTASDATGNESAWSAEVSATPATGGGGGDPTAWINEFHYDNDGTDTGEFFEIAGTAGLDLSGWTVLGYNGSGGVVYDTENLSGVLPDLQAGFGVLDFAMAGMQNGSPDGLALVDDAGTVVQFISYEGAITAVDGPAAGQTSVDVGVSEPTSTPVGWSLQLGGTGSVYADFAWQSARSATRGAVNAGQTFEGGAPVNQAPVAEANGPYSGDEGAAIAFSSAGSADSDGTLVGWHWDFGDGAISTAANPSHAYAIAGGYTVTLTVTDDQGATGQDTALVTVSDVTPPAAPAGLAATAGDGSVDLDWADNGEGDLAGYTVYRASASGGPYAALNGSLLTVSAYTDNSVTNGSTYWYVVSASDGSGNTSAQGAEVSALPAGQSGGGDATVWINEFHYDNDGTDTGEFFEIAGTTGTDLTGWSVVGYNGSGGVVYDTVNLSGTLPATMGGFGVLSFPMPGMQNGSPDGLALVDGLGDVVLFLSYEGVIVATDGPAAGLTSVDVGVAEATTATVGHSLQLGGTGSVYGDFTWQASAANTAGAVNTGQTLGDGSTGGGSWSVITYDDFESGLGSYTDGGGDMARYAGAYSHQGTYSANIQDNSGVASSFYHTTGHDVSGFTDLEVEFWYKPISMDKTGEDFWVQYWDGSVWRTVAVFDKGVDFENGNFYNVTVQIPSGTYAYPTDAKLRFLCDASGNADDVFIDEITFRGFGN